MQKICIFTGFFLPHLGGVERYTNELVKELKKNSFEVIIVTANDNDYPSYEKLKDYTIYRLPVYNLFKNRYPILKKNKTYKEIINKLNKENFTAYICQTRFYLLTQVGVKMANNHNKEAIIIEHGSNHFTVNNKIFDFLGAKFEHYLTNRLKRKKVKFYGVSKRCNEWLKHFKIDAKEVLYNSINDKTYELYKDKHYLNKKKNKIYLGYIGRIIPEKGIELLLEVVKKLSKKYHNIELYIAGDGVEMEQYIAKYQEENIHFLGKLSYDDVLKLDNDLDIFIHPSMYAEGLPTSILEAGIMKTAVIATDRGGTVEVINNEDVGLIMEENEASLKEKLSYLLDNPKEITKLKNNIHKRVMNNFTWSITAKKLIKEVNNEKN